MSAFVTTGAAPIGTRECPGCGATLPQGVVLFCEPCWWKIPAPERQALAKQYRTNPKNPAAYESKVEACVRFLRLSCNVVRSRRIDARLE